MSIFRAYDIRGIYPKEINENLAEKIGLAFGTFLKQKYKNKKIKIFVGYDVRESSPKLKERLINGLLSTGIDVIDIGLVSTPMLYFSVAYYKLDGGVMITASHNPPEYNGFKFVGKNAISFSYETGIKFIEDLIKKEKFEKNDKGNLEAKNIENDYINFVLSNVKIDKSLKIVIDAGNGCCGLFAPKIFEKLGFDVVKLYCEPDGRFPNHLADPSKKETLKDLQKKVLEVKADLGIAYDGDGDRAGFVDENGNIIDNNIIFALLIKKTLEKIPKAKILYEVTCSRLIEDIIKKCGGQGILSKVGHSYIQQIMAKESCELGGETSGHYYFKETFGYDDGIFTSLKIVEIILKEKISEMIKEFPKYYSSEDIRVFCPDEEKFNFVEKIKNELKLKGYKIIDLDGVKILFENGWGIIRASNTRPAISFMWESKTKEEYDKIGKILKNIIDELKSLYKNS